jgi:hypothetical protein
MRVFSEQARNDEPMARLLTAIVNQPVAVGLVRDAFRTDWFRTD